MYVVTLDIVGNVPVIFAVGKVCVLRFAISAVGSLFVLLVNEGTGASATADLVPLDLGLVPFFFGVAQQDMIQYATTATRHKSKIPTRIQFNPPLVADKPDGVTVAFRVVDTFDMAAMSSSDEFVATTALLSDKIAIAHPTA